MSFPLCALCAGEKYADVSQTCRERLADRLGMCVGNLGKGKKIERGIAVEPGSVREIHAAVAFLRKSKFSEANANRLQSCTSLLAIVL